MTPRTIHAVIDHRIRVDLDAIPDDADDAVIDALCIPNLERENAKKQHLSGWEDLPELLVMYGLTGPRESATLDMPRGFGFDFADGMEEYGVEVVWEDRRSRPTTFRVGRKIDQRDHQWAAVKAILEAEHGIYKAPPGSGKTVVVLQAGRQAGTRCLVIVNTKDILYQWVDRIHEHLGDHMRVGIIGDNQFEPGPIWTVAIANTLHSRFDQLEADGFFDSFGFAALDECHHATAETYLRIIDRLSSAIRIGVSYTPDKTGDFALAQLVLGPVIHSTTHGELQDSGFLIQPKIVRVKTDFGFNFKGTTSRYSRSNYPEMLSALLDDRDRNLSIVGALMKESGNHCLVPTQRHGHIDLLEAMLDDAGYEFPIYRLTGKETSAERKRIIGAMGSEPGCVFSTVADEALDVPRLDRGFLVFPQRNTGLVEQQMGRFERAHEDKKDAIIYDWADVKVTALRAQWRQRWLNVYAKRKLEIIKTHANDYISDASRL